MSMEFVRATVAREVRSSPSAAPAKRRQVDDDLGDDLAVADDYHHIGLEGAKFFDDLGTANPLRLKDREF